MPRQKKKPLILVDGSSYLYRAYHAMPPLTNSNGEPTGTVYGVINMLRKLIQEYQPDEMVVIFDARGKTFRDDLYPEYKANRPPMPADLSQQVEPLLDIVRAMGLPLMQVPGVEADDVIGTLARQAEAKGQEVVISTGDKDMAQLVDDKISLINTMTNASMDEQGVKDKFGVTPSQIIDYLALIGDTSDNVPGIPKVGPKTAARWLDEFKNLDVIIDSADTFKGKIGENLRNSLEQIPLSRQLVTIKCDVDLGQEGGDLTIKTPDRDALIKWFGRLEFKTWLGEILDSGDPSHVTDSGDVIEVDYETVLTQQCLDQWISKLGKAELFSFDTETTSLDYMQAEIVGLSFSTEPGKAAYVPLAHDYPGAPGQLSRDKVLAQLKPLLENSTPGIIGQHIKYDMNVLTHYGIQLQGIAYDTMLESYVYNSTATRHDMDSLALKYLGYKTVHFEDIAGKGAKQLTFNQIDLEQASPYAAEDADITLRLHQVLWQKLAQEKKSRQVFEQIERPLIPVLSEMECNGVLVDTQMLGKQSVELAKGMDDIARQTYELAGEEFNMSSPKQLQVILFEKLGLPVLKKTPKGQPSTAEEVLQELANDYPIPELILEYRGMNKLKNTYTDRLPEQVDPDTGRVHTSYHQAVAATGRLSSSRPNLQNIPVRTAEGRRIRQAFIAPSGYEMIAADYSQIELRIMAHLSGDRGLLDAFAEGVDVHRATAAEVFAVDRDEVSDDQRRSAKAINFGLIYGMSAFGLARQLGVERRVAQEYVNLYFDRYRGVKKYMEETRERAREQGYVETVFGRRLYLPDIKSRNVQVRQYAERTAINAPMQGTAADIIKLAMISVYEWMQKEKPDMKMIMQVHDELVFEISESEVDQSLKQIAFCMSSAADLSVPLVVDIGRGRNWDEAH
ncbi:MAG TPA: DNA polymerase I [Gammaproteobacteria bacterium]|nr:DNA polymerase I [Gammaproteobacteria bacterium]